MSKVGQIDPCSTIDEFWVALDKLVSEHNITGAVVALIYDNGDAVSTHQFGCTEQDFTNAATLIGSWYGADIIQFSPGS